MSPSNRKAENNCCDKIHSALPSRRGSNGRPVNGSDEISARQCSERNGGEEKSSGISCTGEGYNLDEHMKSDVTFKRARKKKEITVEDMHNIMDDDDDEEDDSDWDPSQKKKEITVEDMHDIMDDDEEDDSDWEPSQNHTEVMKWFCINCTMVNQDTNHCDICGEHQESGIVRHGHLASPSSQGSLLVQAESNVVERFQDSLSGGSSLSTAVGFDERMLLHSEVEMKSHPHPERPDRIRAIAAGLAAAGIFPGRCHPISAREITKEELQRVHSSEHVDAVNLTSRMYSSYFTPDTYANEHSACAARLAAGLCVDLASAIFSGQVKNGFALVRPPGHHAGVTQAMGFCLHNNAAVAALAAQAAGAKKILIVDWDVHHGNGTQEIFERNKSVLYISLHRHEGGNFYPGTGAADEVGSMGAEGYCVNVPWSCGGVGDDDYIFAFQHIVLPIVSEFKPDITIVSAGFDAARGDPLGCCDVTPAGYAKMTHMLDAVSGGKLLVILEGGYNLRSISSSTTAVIKVLLGECLEDELENGAPSVPTLETVLDVLTIQKTYWPTLESSFTIILQSLWASTFPEKSKKELKRKHFTAPVTWKWGPKSLLYNMLMKNQRCRK